MFSIDVLNRKHSKPIDSDVNWGTAKSCLVMLQDRM